MVNALAPAPSPLANSDHRAIRWRRPTGHANHPELIEATIARLLNTLDAVEQRKTLVHNVPIWNSLSNQLRVFDRNPVTDADGNELAPAKRRHRKERAGDEDAGQNASASTPRERKRGLRRDGGKNLISTLCTLLWNADFSKLNSKGYIGTPSDDGNQWEPHTWGALFDYGFGKAIPGEKTLARMERWTRVLADAGFIKTYRRWNQYKEGAWEELPAIKILTTKIFTLCGTIGIYKRLRKGLAKDAETERSRKRLEGMGRLVEMTKHKKLKEAKVPAPVQAQDIQRQQDTLTDPGPPPLPIGMPEGLSGREKFEWLMKNFRSNS